MRTRALALALLVLPAAAAGADRPLSADAARRQAGTALTLPPAPNSPGERLFDVHCAICHAGGKLYPGYLALQQSGAAQPELAKRTDLTVAYVKTVARNGIGAMVPVTPTLLPDHDLDLIAAYLAGNIR